MEYPIGKKLGKFNALMNECGAFYHEIAVKCGMSDSGYEIMRNLLIFGEGCSQTKIYKNSYLNKQTVNSSVKQLVKKGFIQLKKGKGRESEIYVTDQGREFIEKKVLPVEMAENEIFEEMTEAEYEALFGLTERYLESFREKIKTLKDLQVTTDEDRDKRTL